MSAIGDLTNQPGHDLALEIEQRFRAYTVLTGQRPGNQLHPNRSLPVEGSLIGSH